MKSKVKKAVLFNTSGWAIFLVILTGCQFTSRVRTLPEEIESVYVPMFINNTSQPGLEELATRATVEAFLADGRLDVVSKSKADAVVQGIILDFKDDVKSTGASDFPMMNNIQVRVRVKLYSPEELLHPMQEYKPFNVTRTYISDIRRVTMTIPEDALQELMDALGQQLVLKVMTGEFEEIKP